MTNLQQAAQQALEALEGELWLMLDKPEDEQYRVKYAYLLTVITALRTALEQQAEPVAYYHPRNGFYWAKPTSIFAPTVVDVPPIPLYTTAAKREWVGLTPKEILDMFDVNNVYGSKWIEFARTVEAALRSKNT